jgi:hypothetical protein
MEDLIDSYQFFNCLKEAASTVDKEVSEPVSYFENSDLCTVTFIWNME